MAQATETANYTVSVKDGVTVLTLVGAWTVANVGRLDRALRNLRVRDTEEVAVDLSDVEKLDTAGAWVISRTCVAIDETLHKRGCYPAEIRGASEDQLLLMRRVNSRFAPCDIEPPRGNSIVRKIAAIGEAVEIIGKGIVETIVFGGAVVEAMGRTIINPRRFRWTSFLVHMEQAGLNALPIIALMSFLIGAVLTFLGADVLADYGTKIFVADMLAYGVLREFGVLLTTIMIAGRSGSAFTASIGSMKAREEIDAMRTLGLDPVEVLVMPRILALMVATPLLTVLADVAGVFGGGIIAWSVFDIPPSAFISRFETAAQLSYFWVGLIKAPIFAFLVGMIGCYQGMQVGGSAESVGLRTTQSVVNSIFVVIVADALFAMYFQQIGF